MRRLPLFVLPAVLFLVSCIAHESQFLSSDCTAPVPAQFTRIYIGIPSPGGQQSGTSALDPLDGSTADKFDTVLRTIAEGQRPTWGTQSQIPPENLIVCIGPGVFHTQGQYDWVVGAGRTQGASNVGFTVEKNWRIHGHGTHQTMLELAGFAEGEFQDSAGTPFTGGSNTVIGTHSDDASGIEISDVTINANHDNLNRASGLPLNLDAIVLRSLHGGHWIHDVHIVGVSGDLGVRNSRYETFPVLIWGDNQALDPSQSQGNLVERVTLSRPGSTVGPGSFPGGAVTAIAVANAAAEVRNNNLDGYSIAYGGWAMQSVWFHDNVGINNRYGFNTDSWNNFDVTLQSNRFIHPSLYGIVLGGASQQQKFSRWSIRDNTIEVDAPHVVGVILQGQVQGVTFESNKVFSDSPPPKNVTAIYSFPTVNGVTNFGNSFVNNQIDSSQHIDFSRDPDFNTNCRFQNRDLHGHPLPDFPDNTNSPAGACAASGAPAP